MYNIVTNIIDKKKQSKTYPVKVGQPQRPVTPICDLWLLLLVQAARDQLQAPPHPTTNTLQPRVIQKSANKQKLLNFVVFAAEY